MRQGEVRKAGVLGLVAGVAALAAGAGCQGPPQGEPWGRYSSTTTTPAEASSEKILPASLIEASDTVTQALIADVQRVSDEVGAGKRVTVVFGNIVNKTQGAVATQEFELVRDRIKTRLVQSRLFRDNVRFVASRAAIEELNRRELGGGSGDLLQERGGGAGGASGATEALAGEYTLYLNGTMYAIFRGSTNFYYLKFELDRASTRETVFAQDYEVKRG